MLFVHLFCILAASTSLADATETAAPDSITPKVVMGPVTLSGDRISFESAGGTNTCTVEGGATLILGEVVHTADTIQWTTDSSSGKNSTFAVKCVGNVTTRNDDNTGDRMSGDLLVYDHSWKWKLSGNARIEYGSDSNKTKITCESVTFGKGIGGYQFSGNVELQHDQ